MFGLLRDLANPLAAPPDINPRPDGRHLRRHRPGGRRGSRLSGTRRLGAGRDGAPADRRRRRAAACGTTGRTSSPTPGQPTDSVLLDQREKVTELGPFAQLQWSPRRAAAAERRRPVRLGPLRPWTTTTWATDPTTAARAPCRRRAATSGASWSFGDRFVPYVNVSTSFETPTTTELVNQPDGSGGFNPDLGSAARGQLRDRRARAARARRDLFRGAVPRPDHRCDRAGRRDRRARVLRQRGEDPQRRRRGRAHRHAGRRASR